MSGGGRPWFRFWVTDFIGDANVMAMEPGARGIYITLLCFMYQGYDPSPDEAELRNLLAPGTQMRTFRRWWSQVLPCLELDETSGKLWHKRVRKEVESSAKRFRQKSIAGRKGADSRWQKASSASGNPIFHIPEPELKPSPTPPAGRGGGGVRGKAAWKQVLPPELQAPELLDALVEWDRGARRRKKAAMTQRARRGQVTRLVARAGHDVHKAVQLVLKAEEENWKKIIDEDGMDNLSPRRPAERAGPVLEFHNPFPEARDGA